MNFDSGGHAIWECESTIRRTSDVPLRWHPMMKIGGAPDVVDREGAANRGATASLTGRSRRNARLTLSEAISRA